MDVLKVIPQTKIGEITNRLTYAGRPKRLLPKDIRSKGGDKGAAKRAAQDMIPGGKTQLFNTLSQDKCLVNVRSVGPPLILADMDEKKKLLSTRSIKWLCMMS